MRMTKNFDVNHSEVTDVDEELWRAFQFVNNINLNGNNLEFISGDFTVIGLLECHPRYQKQSL